MKILLFDIETKPLISYTWGIYEQDVIAVKEDWYILSFSAKWFKGKTITKILPDYKLYKKDPKNDKELVKELHGLFEQADVIIGHNGDKFDIKKTKTRFIYHNLPPPHPYKTIDTLKVAKNQFAFTSNKLDALGEFLKVGRKVNTGGFELWLRCMLNDKKAWKKMRKYNRMDTILLEKIYLKLRPWIDNHPNIGAFERKAICPKCGSGKLQKRGLGLNAISRYQRLQCMDCGGWCNMKLKEPKVVIYK